MRWCIPPLLLVGADANACRQVATISCTRGKQGMKRSREAVWLPNLRLTAAASGHIINLRSGRSAVWLARVYGVHEVASSSLAAPTSLLVKDRRDGQ